MSAAAIFVEFTPKKSKFATSAPRLWGRLRPLGAECQPSVTDATDTVQDESRALIGEVPEYGLKLVAASNTQIAEPSAVNIDLDDYQ